MRLIDADLLKENWGKFDHRRRLVECINEQPTVEAAPVVRGKWVEDEDENGRLACPVCGEDQIHSTDGGGHYYKSAYCPWCGARME